MCIYNLKNILLPLSVEWKEIFKIFFPWMLETDFCSKQNTNIYIYVSVYVYVYMYFWLFTYHFSETLLFTTAKAVHLLSTHHNCNYIACRCWEESKNAQQKITWMATRIWPSWRFQAWQLKLILLTSWCTKILWVSSSLARSIGCEIPLRWYVLSEWSHLKSMPTVFSNVIV